LVIDLIFKHFKPERGKIPASDQLVRRVTVVGAVAFSLDGSRVLERDKVERRLAVLSISRTHLLLSKDKKLSVFSLDGGVKTVHKSKLRREPQGINTSPTGMGPSLVYDKAHSLEGWREIAS
jgi:hypothetical protein